MESPHLILEISLGARRGKKAVLSPGASLKVGRSEASGLAIPDDSRLSAAHFELSWDGARAALRDLNSITGTRLGGDSIVEADVTHGSWIRAGNTDFIVYVEGHTPPAPEADDDDEGDDDTQVAPEDENDDPPPFPAEAPEPSPEDDGDPTEVAAEREELALFRQARAVERRQQRRQRVAREAAAARALPVLRSAAAASALHAILDGARTPRILQVLHEALEEHRSLYEGVKGEALDDVAPRLVRLGPDARLLAQLVREGWGRRWGIFAEGHVPPKDLRRHLRRFLVAEDDVTQERLYFRFYDPGVLRSLWPTCSRRQLEALIGPLRAFLVEGERGEVLRLTADGNVAPWTGSG